MKVEIMIYTDINRAPIKKEYFVDHYHEAIDRTYHYIDSVNLEYTMIWGNVVEENEDV